MKTVLPKKGGIDVPVFRLYELTYDEVKIVDPEFGLSWEEYNSH